MVMNKREQRVLIGVGLVWIIGIAYFMYEAL
jgi:hypothetical protein